ncbi:hypothetical protein WR25_11356 [Diploscapter pachys]|uniref:Uncharacterized protein n=1 Tax=Diploscapter pachys TaxID=2018661 RepID=A0A2A2LDB5_9BILA|nr:hypothetical protein WR25_11356 [Diploscapter pachys]
MWGRAPPESSVASGQRRNLVAFASDPSGELDVLGHDGDTLGVDGAQIGVLEQADQVGFGSLMQGEHCRRLEAEIRLEVLCDFTNETLKFTELEGERISKLFTWKGSFLSRSSVDFW